jgi:hypothetical protein
MIHATTKDGMMQSSQEFSIRQPLSMDAAAADADVDEGHSPSRILAARRTLRNFKLMSLLFSANHGCAVGKNMRQK